MKGIAIGAVIGFIILSLGFSQASFGYFEGSPYDQQDDGVPISEITCRGDRVLMIDLRGKPGCALQDHVDELESYDWSVIKESSMMEGAEMMEEDEMKMEDKEMMMEEDEMMMEDKEMMMEEDEMMMSIGGIDISMAAPVEGEADAPITIIEFGDYQCPKCDQWFLQEKPSITSSLLDTGKAKLYFLDFAFLGDDSNSAGQAAYCAGDQDMYLEYHSILYTKQGGINDGWASPPALKNFAADIGLNTDMFNDCLDSGKYADRVSYNKDVATSNGVQATPTFFIVSGDGEVKKIEGAQPTSIFLGTINEFGKGY